MSTNGAMIGETVDTIQKARKQTRSVPKVEPPELSEEAAGMTTQKAADQPSATDLTPLAGIRFSDSDAPGHYNLRQKSVFYPNKSEPYPKPWEGEVTAALYSAINS